MSFIAESVSAPSVLSVLRRQFDVSWGLFDYHLSRLDGADFLWEPAAVCWTVRQTVDGGWEPDWADVEPDPVPVPTVAWLTWHIGWWWSVSIDHLRDEAPRDRTAVVWPGPTGATVEWMRDLAGQWRELLGAVPDLGAPARFPWRDDPAVTVADAVAWVNVELMKNAAEVGQLRMLRTVGSFGG